LDAPALSECNQGLGLIGTCGYTGTGIISPGRATRNGLAGPLAAFPSPKGGGNPVLGLKGA